MLATEGWELNILVVRAVLGPLKIPVIPYGADACPLLPVAGASIDLVMARHESYDAGEAQHTAGVTRPRRGRGAGEAGLEVFDAGDWTGEMVFANAVALVEYMAMVPWDVPGFRVDDHLETLRLVDERAPIRVTQRRFWLHVRKQWRPQRIRSLQLPEEIRRR